MTEKPMNIREAIEAMKILALYTTEAPRDSSLHFIGGLVAAMHRGVPVDAFRLIALMQHRPVEDVAASLKEGGPAALVTALAEGFNVNALPDLVEASFGLGIGKDRWSDA